MVPVMYVLSGAFTESPQRTHFWNNIKYEFIDLNFLDIDKAVFCLKSDSAKRPWFAFIPLFHMKIFGGWDTYIVLEPAVTEEEWFVGWCGESVNGISQIPLKGKVRLLVGSRDVWFFGIKENGEQIKITEIGRGQIGEEGQFSHTPFL